MSFEQTPEYIQSLNMRPACDRVLCEVFNVSPEKIERFDKQDELFILDKEFSIDMRVHLNNGSQVTGQEKALSHDKSSFRTFTMEFYQNRFTKEPGEFFKIASQFYLHGYSDSSGIEFKEWKLIDILLLMGWLRNRPVEQLEKSTRPSTSRASFFYIKYDDIPKRYILFNSARKGAS